MSATPVPALVPALTVNVAKFQAPNNTFVVLLSVGISSGALVTNFAMTSAEARQLSEALKKIAQDCETSILVPNPGLAKA